MSELDHSAIPALDRLLALISDQVVETRAALRAAVVDDEGAPFLILREIVSLDECERQYVLRVLSHFDRNKTHAAEALGVDASTLHRKLNRWSTPMTGDRASSRVP